MRDRDARTWREWISCASLLLGSLGCALPTLADNVHGGWSASAPWPMVPIHAVLMPDGRVLTFGTLGSQLFDVWNPAAGLHGGHTTLPNTIGSNLFCSAALVLPSGSGVFIAGGGPESDPNQDTRIFSYAGNSLTRSNDLNRGRYYASTTTLTDGSTFIQGGTGGADRPEIRHADGSISLLSGADTRGLNDYYPRNFVAPDGRVFGFDADGVMYYINTAGSGSLNTVGTLSAPIGFASTVAMFRPGRILHFGARSSGARVIDITGATPRANFTQSLSSQRNWATATVLADGRVLATGGSEVRNELVGVNNSAEIWNPETGQWLRGADGSVPRLYHSTALLLPDGSVLVGGGGNPGPLSNDNAEIYYPPYLYGADGAFAARPVIATAPGEISINSSFPVGLSAAEDIRRVALVKTGAVTHSFNMDQRFVELTFQRSGSQLTVQSPTRAADAPPGFYLLFVLNAAGTPSVARMVRIGVVPVPGNPSSPVLADPGSQSGQLGIPASLQLAATDPDQDPLVYGASGLPPGLAIDPSTGIISGAPTTIGTYDVSATVSDGTSSDSRSFVWTILQSTVPFILNPIPTPPATLAGATTILTASVEGGVDVRYKWNFDDGTPETTFSSSPAIAHTFAEPGIYYVTVTAIDAGGIPQVTTVVVKVHLPLTANRPAVSGNIAVEDRAGAIDRLWVVNQDDDSVAVFSLTSNAKLAEITVGAGPRALAVTRAGEVWVTNKFDGTVSVVDAATLSLARTIPMPYGSQPFGIAAAPTGGIIYVVLEASGRLLKLDASNGAVIDSVDVGRNPRHASVSASGQFVYVSRYITSPLPGESTASVQVDANDNAVGAEIVVVDGPAMAVTGVVKLHHSDKPDFEIQGRGIPNYLGAAALSPDGQSAWVPSKQDNIKRGVLRDGQHLNFQNTVRAISSRISLTTRQETYSARIDHDNSGVASAAVYDLLGVYMFVALETSREVAVVDAHGQWEIFRISTGRAPQGLAISPDGRTLYVNNFMDRTLGVYDISRLVDDGIADVPLIATRATVSSEKLSAKVLKGKQFFYDAKDTRLARDGYVSCASCHNDGGHDGRVWDLTGFGEGLRNTVQLRGRGGAQGQLHWSNNFDEVQDFEGQIRSLAGGTGLMTNAQFSTGSRSEPLGDRKSGISSNLDALAAYVASLTSFAASPYRDPDGTLTARGGEGRAVFAARNCASCHGGTAYTISENNNSQDIGTVTPASGKRLGGALQGIDVPTLRDVWATAPYLHSGSAISVADAIKAHAGLDLSDDELTNLTQYVLQIGREELEAPGTTAPPPSESPNTGTGLTGRYFNNPTLTGTPVLQRVEAVNFSWASEAPGPGVSADRFSVRWTGRIEAPASGTYRFQTMSNDGIRLWINGVLVIDNWTDHATATNSSNTISLAKNQRYAVTLEFYDNTGSAVARLQWQRPSQSQFAAIPASRLYAN